MKYKIAQFIPIILIFLLLSYSNKMAEYSHSILGKLIAVIIIIFYTVLDKMVGLLVCTLIIFYYQSDYIENMLNMVEGFDVDHSTESPNVQEDSHSPEDNDLNNYVLNTNSKNKKKIEENMTNYNELYTNNDAFTPANNELINQFRKQNCDGNVLKHKNMVVRQDMMQYVFPELNFEGQPPCNPCNVKCNTFSIIESKLKTEKDMIPKSSIDEINMMK